jgi:hypothetical protein
VIKRAAEKTFPPPRRRKPETKLHTEAPFQKKRPFAMLLGRMLINTINILGIYPIKNIMSIKNPQKVKKTIKTVKFFKKPVRQRAAGLPRRQKQGLLI